MKVSIHGTKPLLPERQVEQQETLTETVEVYLAGLKMEGVAWPTEVLVLWPKTVEPWKKIKKVVKIDANGPVTKRW